MSNELTKILSGVSEETQERRMGLEHDLSQSLVIESIMQQLDEIRTNTHTKLVALHAEIIKAQTKIALHDTLILNDANDIQTLLDKITQHEKELQDLYSIVETGHNHTAYEDSLPDIKETKED